MICCESLLGWAGWWLRGWVKNSEFYEQVLGLQWPWKVEQVELDRAAQRVVVHVGWNRGRSGVIRRRKGRRMCTSGGNAGGGIWTPASLRR